MSARQQPLALVVRRGIRYQLIGLCLSLALAVLIAAPASEDRLQAALLVLVGVGFVLDGRLLRADGAVLAVAEPPRPSWIPWVSGLAFALGVTLILAAVLFLWPSRASP